MKSLRNSLLMLVLFVFVGNANGIAQTSIKDVKGATDTQKELRDEAAKKKEEAQKVKDKVGSATGDASSVSQASADEISKIKEKLAKTTNKNERKALLKDIERLEGGSMDEIADKVGDVKDGRSKPNEAMKDEMRKYKENLKDASPEERKELEAKMQELEKQKLEMKDEVKDAKKEAAATEVKAYSDLKGREYGNARATDAKKMIEKKQADMVNRDQFVASGKDRVAAARTRVQTDLDSGKINKEQAAEKLAKIASAEKRLNAYQTRVNDSRQKLSDHKEKVSDYIKN